jgi:hypothetical protein
MFVWRFHSVARSTQSSACPGFWAIDAMTLEMHMIQVTLIVHFIQMRWMNMKNIMIKAFQHSAECQTI